jgi:uncharacterized protein
MSPVIDYRATFVMPELTWGRGRFTSEKVEQLRSVGRVRLTPHFVAGQGLYDEMAYLRPYEVLESVHCDVFLIHGTEDDKVPISTVRKDAARFSNRVTYLEVPAGDHSLVGAPPAVDGSDRIVNWFGDM